MKDPYLIPGQICEIEWNGKIFIRYFLYVENKKRFVFGSHKNSTHGLVFKNYRPIGTEWDFAPEWAMCSTVSENGIIESWNTEKLSLHAVLSGKGQYICRKRHKKITIGYCQDKTRYENGAWKTSLRMRPEWAK